MVSLVTARVKSRTCLGFMPRSVSQSSISITMGVSSSSGHLDHCIGASGVLSSRDEGVVAGLQRRRDVVRGVRPTVALLGVLSERIAPLESLSHQGVFSLPLELPLGVVEGLLEIVKNPELEHVRPGEVPRPKALDQLCLADDRSQPGRDGKLDSDEFATFSRLVVSSLGMAGVSCSTHPLPNHIHPIQALYPQ